jgi:hypothetical protein
VRPHSAKSSTSSITRKTCTHLSEAINVSNAATHTREVAIYDVTCRTVTPRSSSSVHGKIATRCLEAKSSSVNISNGTKSRGVSRVHCVVNHLVKSVSWNLTLKKLMDRSIVSCAETSSRPAASIYFTYRISIRPESQQICRVRTAKTRPIFFRPKKPSAIT